MSTPERFSSVATPANTFPRIPPVRQHGISLIELIMFLIIVSLGAVALLSVFTTTVRKSTDPMVRKQMLAIAFDPLHKAQVAL